MLNINTDTFEIAITRGDSASITFSAIQMDGKTYEPSVGEILKFAVAKKWGGEPLMDIPNTLEEMPSTYVLATPTEEDFTLEPEHYYTEEEGVYTQCTSADVYDPETPYYILDFSSWWTINITRSDWLDSAGNDKFKFADYVYDVQISTDTDDITIIGKDDDNGIEPTFKVLGEVAEE